MSLLTDLQTLSSGSYSKPQTVLYNIISDILKEEASRGNTSYVLNKNSAIQLAKKPDNWYKYQNRGNINWQTTLNAVRTQLETEGITISISGDYITFSW